VKYYVSAETAQRHLDGALAWAALGVPVLICYPADWHEPELQKAPIGACCQRGVHSATANPAMLRRWWKRHPEGIIGLALGERSGIVAVDLDCHDGQANGFDTLATLGVTAESISPFWETTPSGNGRHYLCAYAPGLSSFKLDGIDVISTGKYICAWPSAGYAWGGQLLSDLGLLPPVPLEILAARGREPERRKIEPHPVSPVPCHVRAVHAGCGVSLDPDDSWQPPDDDEVIFALYSIDPHARELRYDDWFGIACALASHFGDSGREHFVDWSDWSREKYPKGMSPERLWRSLRDREGYTVATVFHFANEHRPSWREAYHTWREQNAEE
jgi:hypothetical protein